MYLAAPQIAQTLKAHDLVHVLEIASSGLKITPYRKSRDGAFFIKEKRTKFSFLKGKEGDRFEGQLWSDSKDKDGRRYLTVDALSYLGQHFEDAVNNARTLGAGIIAYSTSPFRNAANGERARKFLENKTDIEIGVISGIEEGLMEAIALHARCPEIAKDPCRYAVIGIGGGSTQFFRFNKRGWQFTGIDLGMASQVHPQKAYKEAVNEFSPLEKDLSGLKTLYVVGNSANRTLLEVAEFKRRGDNAYAPFNPVKRILRSIFELNQPEDLPVSFTTGPALISGVLENITARNIQIMRHVYPSDGVFGYHDYGLRTEAEKSRPKAPRINRAALAKAI